MDRQGNRNLRLVTGEKVKRNNISEKSQHEHLQRNTTLPQLAAVVLLSDVQASPLLIAVLPQSTRDGDQPVGNVLIRADSRDSLRATVLRCVTPLPAARCISG